MASVDTLPGVSRHPLRLGRAGRILILPLIWSRPYAEIDDGRLRIHMGWLGRADVPLRAISVAREFHWPWWGGIGVRLGGSGLVAYVTRSGRCALMELETPQRVLMPVPWAAQRIGVSVEDVERFLAELAAARLGVPAEEP